jgi:hypothetical protein
MRCGFECKAKQKIQEWNTRNGTHEIQTNTFKAKSGRLTMCLPTSSMAASQIEMAESRNHPSTTLCTRSSPKTQGSTYTIAPTYIMFAIKFKRTWLNDLLEKNILVQHIYFSTRKIKSTKVSMVTIL